MFVCMFVSVFVDSLLEWWPQVYPSIASVIAHFLYVGLISSRAWSTAISHIHLIGPLCPSLLLLECLCVCQFAYFSNCMYIYAHPFTCMSPLTLIRSDGSLSIPTAYISYTTFFRGVNLGGWEVATPSFGQKVERCRRGSWNIIVSYHVHEVCRKWWLLKRNRIICPEVNFLK